MVANFQTYRSRIYQRGKRLGLNVKWSMNTDQLQQAILKDINKKRAMRTISNKLQFIRSKRALENKASNTLKKAFKKVQAKRDREVAKAINKSSGITEIPLNQFNRIFRQIHSPADKTLLAHVKDNYGQITRTFNLYNSHFRSNNLFITEHETFSSGADEDLEIHPTTSIRLQWYDNPKRSHSERKNFFPYITKAFYFGLEPFQVYNMDDDIRVDSETPCFLYALKIAGVDDQTLRSITHTMFHSGATIDFIRKTAKDFNLHISVKQYRNDKDGKANSQISHYGDKSLPVLKLGSVAKHLFAIKPTEITRYALEKYDYVAKHGCSFIIRNNKVYSFDEKRTKYLNSYEVISTLYHLHNKDPNSSPLIPIDMANTPNLLNNQYQKIDSLTKYDFNEKNFKQIGRVDGKLKLGQTPFKEIVYPECSDEKCNNENRCNKCKKSKKQVDAKFDVCYFDIETMVRGDKHIPYCVAWRSSDDEETQAIYGYDCMKRFLETFAIGSKTLLWAHNAGFDARFIIKHMTGFSVDNSIIDSGTRLKQLHGYYYGREFMVKDTMAFINAKLANLPEMFKEACSDIQLEKESFPHELINDSNFNKPWELSYLDSFDGKETLLANASKIEAVKDNMFDTKKYAIHYCKRDVDVLYHCFEAFRKMFIDRFKVDVYRFISMPGLAYAIQHNEGVFDGCYSMKGVPLAFTRSAIVGGRVMTRGNKKWHVLDPNIDFDAVSLYPSAQARLHGYVLGIPKLFRETIPTDNDYFIARVRIDSIGKKLKFPLQSKFNGQARNFTNNMVGETIIIGKDALEDLVNFQQATYTVIEGMYWNEGFNKQITKTIKSLFQERLELKAQKNPLQNGIKLLMNSAYGKLIQKPIIKSKNFIRASSKKPTAIEDYTCKNIHKLIQRTMITDDIALFEEHKSVNEHWSPAHLGVQVLDMSKRIMNEVMCLSEEIGSTPYYQDTDSMILDKDKIEPLAKAFKLRYDRELVGEQLGQFHTDFEMYVDPIETEKRKLESDGTLKITKGVYSRESYFIAKKTYVCELIVKHKDYTDYANIIRHHIRCKGIPGKLLKEDTMNEYKNMYEGIEISKDLADCCPININSKTQKVSKRFSMIRKLKFPNPETSSDDDFP